jgi:hypothetical protein
MNHRLRALSTTFVLSACLLIVGCDPHPPVRWLQSPDRRTARALDVHSLDSDPNVQVEQGLFFAVGVSRFCGDPVPPDPDGDNLDQKAHDLGRVVAATFLAEVEKQQPGDVANEEAATHIWYEMMEQALDRGWDAAKVRGCAAVEPEETAALRALRSWRP